MVWALVFPLFCLFCYNFPILNALNSNNKIVILGYLCVKYNQVIKKILIRGKLKWQFGKIYTFIIIKTPDWKRNWSSYLNWRLKMTSRLWMNRKMLTLLLVLEVMERFYKPFEKPVFVRIVYIPE